MIPRFLIIFIFAFAPTSWTNAEESLASPNILLAETTTFSLSGPSLNWPRWPELSPLFLHQIKSEPLLQVADNQTKFIYRLGAVKTGFHQIPATQIGNQKTTPHFIRIYPNKLLQAGEFFVDGQKLPFYSAILIANQTPFPSQEVAVEAKLYLPAELDILDPAYPEFRKKNLAANVFEPRQGTGEILVKGRKFVAYSFSSHLSLLSAGEAKIGPGKISPLVNLRTFDRGIAHWQKVRLELELPGATLHAKSLPKPKPADFSGAIGRFSLSATCSQNETNVNAPLQITLSLKGSGANAHTRAPNLSTSSGWRSGPATRNARLSNATQTVFTRIIRPLDTHDAVPPFVFTYYDPDLSSYQTARSEAIPISIQAAKTDSSLSGFSQPVDALPRHWPQWINWLWQLVPACAVIILLRKRLWMRKLARAPQDAIWHDDFQSLAAKKDEAAPGFYRALGQFLEKHPLPDEDLQAAWLRERDLVCFQSQKKSMQREPEAARILQKIKGLVTLIIFCLMFTVQSAESAIDYAAMQKKYSAAPASSSRAHNLAICAYHLGQPGLAAWHFRRSDLPQSKNDLAHIEKETGAITAHEPSPAEFAAHLPRWVYTQFIFAGFWMIAIAFLTKAKRIKLILASSLTFSIASGIAYWNYPSDISFRPKEELATVVAPSDLRPAPLQSALPIREIPAASLANIIKVESDWTYLELPGQVRGWMPSSAIKKNAD